MISPEYLRIKDAAFYASIGVRALRDALRDRRHPLPHYRVSRKMILIRRRDLDSWMEQFRVDPAKHAEDVDGIVDEVVRGVRS